jgi:hypothetical protein
MSKVAQGLKGLFSGGAASGLADQAKAIGKQERDVAAAAAGQQRARSSNRGLLAFIDDRLKSTFGG